MRGSDSDPGMMILCIRDIFDYISSHPKRVFELKVSYLEVYNEEINDLLNTGPVSEALCLTAPYIKSFMPSILILVELQKSSHRI
jgi:hypothetical protein